MKKLLVLGVMLSAVMLTGAGCAGNNTPATQPPANTSAATQSSAQSAGQLPASQPTASQNTTPPATSQPPVQPAAPQAETHQVSIANFAFSSGSVTIKAGDAVKWTNDDQFAHSIKSDNGAFPNSTNLNTGNSYEFKFTTPGTYNYSCGIHPSMRGQIVVQ